MLNETSRHSLFLRFQAVFLFVLMPFNVGGRFLFAGLLASDVIFIMMYDGLRKIKVSFLEIALVMYFGMWLLYSYHFQGLQRMIQLLILMLTYYISRYMTRCSRKDYIFIGITASVSVSIFFLQWAYSGFSFRSVQFSSINEDYNPNSIGAIVYNAVIMLNIISCVLYSDSDRKKLQAAQVLGVLVLLASRCRGSIGAVFIYFLAEYFFRKCSETKRVKAYNFALLFMFSFAIIFTAVYASLAQTEIGAVLNVWSWQYTGKNFFSGRHRFWQALIEAIAVRPLQGYGLHVQPSTVTDIGLSAHNLYLQILLQCGFVGLFLLAAFTYRIAKNVKASYLAPQGIAYFCAIIFNECFEPTITQIGFIYGCVTWLILGIIANSRRR